MARRAVSRRRTGVRGRRVGRERAYARRERRRRCSVGTSRARARGRCPRYNFAGAVPETPAPPTDPVTHLPTRWHPSGRPDHLPPSGAATSGAAVTGAASPTVLPSRTPAGPIRRSSHSLQAHRRSATCPSCRAGPTWPVSAYSRRWACVSVGAAPCPAATRCWRCLRSAALNSTTYTVRILCPSLVVPGRIATSGLTVTAGVTRY